MDKEKLHYLLSHPDWSELDYLWMEDLIQNHTMELFIQLKSLFKVQSTTEQTIPESISNRLSSALSDYIKQESAQCGHSKAYMSCGMETFFHKYADVPIAADGRNESFENGFNKETGYKHKKNGHNRKKYARFDIAASILFIFACGIFVQVYLTGVRNSETKVMSVLNADQSVIQEDTIVNHSAHTKVVYLADSTKVNLMPQSLVYFNRSFDIKRIVYLEGEAIFSVKKESGRSFSVYAGEIEVRDLGTIFQVVNKKDSLSVRLIKGKLLLHSREQASSFKGDIVMKPGELFKMDKANKQYLVIGVKNAVSERRRAKTKILPKRPVTHLVFVNTPLTKVLDQVATRFHLKILYDEEKLENKLFTGDLSRLDSSEKMLIMICIPNSLEFDKKGDFVIVK